MTAIDKVNLAFTMTNEVIDRLVRSKIVIGLCMGYMYFLFGLMLSLLYLGADFWEFHRTTQMIYGIVTFCAIGFPLVLILERFLKKNGTSP